MILNHITSRSRDPDQSGLANGPSRRRVLQAGAAVGGGLLLSVTMAFGVATHLLVIGGSPVPAIVLGALSGFVAYRLRRTGGVLTQLRVAR